MNATPNDRPGRPRPRIRPLTQPCPSTQRLTSTQRPPRRRCPGGWWMVLLLLVGCRDEVTPRDSLPPRSAATRSDAPGVASPNDAKPSDARPSDGQPGDASTGEATKPPATLAQTQRLAAQGKLTEATQMATELLIRDPSDVQVLFLAADLQAQQGNFAEAVELIGGITTDQPDAFLPAQGMSADWLMELGRWDEAIDRYETILRYAPDAALAHRRLASLRNRQGERQAAVAHVRQLGRIGDVTEPELHSLTSEADAFYDGADPDDVSGKNAIGPLGRARIAYSQGDLERALQEMRAGEPDRRSPAATAFFGRLLAETQSYDAMPAWLAGCDPSTRQYGDFWFAIGNWRASRGELRLAAVAYEQCLRITPTDRLAYNLVADCFDKLEKPSIATWYRERGKRVGETFTLGSEIGLQRQADPADVRRYADLLTSLDRPLEAVLWRAVAAMLPGGDRSELARLNQERLKIDAAGPIDTSVHLAPDRREPATSDALIAAVAGLADVPTNAPPGPDQSPTDPAPSRRGQPATLVDVARQTGIIGRYLNDDPPTDDLYMLHQGIGGGVAALDFDVDGRVDLYFTQAAAKLRGADFAAIRATQPNELYRQQTERFADVTMIADADDRGYGQGVSAGDVNADGFPDLYIANIGANTLLINQGDGTFVRGDHTDVAGSAYTTSVAMADLDGDGLTDLIETNYVGDPAVFVDPLASMTDIDPDQPLPAGLMPRPGDFAAQIDRVLINRGDGGFRSFDLKVREGAEVADALAVLVTDVDGRIGNEIFVANDMRGNQLWFNEPVDTAETTSPGDRGWSMVDRGVIAGCAYSSRGDANACMGIASADFTGDGLIDFAVTNFYKEPMNFFVQKTPGTFADEAAKSNLFAIGYDVNGFGTQPIDYDNNAKLDLAVLNGHIHDNSAAGFPFRMLPQLIDGSGPRFEVMPVEDSSGYWNTPALGRSLATLDWNRDGRTDMVASHLNSPHALIENQTAPSGHWIQVCLIGVDCERDAIGARVVVQAGPIRQTATVNSGDGFQCKNERMIAIGLADQTAVDAIDIRWPDGSSQRFENVAPDRRYHLIQGEPLPVLVY